MGLNTQQRADFVNAYTRLLINTWSSDEFAAKLDANPREALAESGLELPAGASIDLIRNIPEDHRDGNIDIQVDLWESGTQSGRYVLYIPETPQVDLAELSEGDLDAIAAGESYCCSCSCPGCSCAPA